MIALAQGLLGQCCVRGSFGSRWHRMRNGQASSKREACRRVEFVRLAYVTMTMMARRLPRCHSGSFGHIPNCCNFDRCSLRRRRIGMSQTLTLQPVTAFTFTTKENQPEEDPSVAARLQRLQNNYEDLGMRRTVEAVLVVHEHGHPHVLMLQIANAFFKLPGDYLRPDEDEVEGLKAKLDQRLGPVDSEPGSFGPNGEGRNKEDGDWEIHDCIAQWWRPSFETFMYPYTPPHITKPKECKKLFLVTIPSTKVLAVPKNMKLLAVPLIDLYDNAQRYGPQLAAIPHLLSRYNFIYSD